VAVLSPKLIIAAAALLTLSPATAESPVGASQQATRPAVHVEHQLVEALERSRVAIAPRRRQAMPARPSAVQFAARPSAVQFAVRPDPAAGLAARAGRLLLGDGRFRPEPFPRPGR
jgi:hypothetical protein